MARADNDSWDPASSVGATATMVAAQRAYATRMGTLIDDPYAEPLVRAVGLDHFTRLAAAEITSAPGDPGAAMELARVIRSMAVRTKFYDEFFHDAGSAGVRQAVILAAGLDTRAYRLDWPSGTVVYEVDQPGVVGLKTRTMQDLGATPSAERCTVAVDLRQDWDSALRDAGFQPSRPTAWSAEGLLGYLASEAQDRLLNTITALSAPGSWIATENVAMPDAAGRVRLAERLRTTAGGWRDRGVGVDITDLIYFDRDEAGQYLSQLGWQTSARTVTELLTVNGLEPLGEDHPLSEMLYVSATLGARSGDAR